MSPALAGRFLTTAPPGKSLDHSFNDLPRSPTGREELGERPESPPPVSQFAGYAAGRREPTRLLKGLCHIHYIHSGVLLAPFYCFS